MMYPSLACFVAFQSGKVFKSSKFSLICMSGNNSLAWSRPNAYQSFNAILAEAFAHFSATCLHSAGVNLRFSILCRPALDIIETLQGGKGWRSQLGVVTRGMQTWPKTVWLMMSVCVARTHDLKMWVHDDSGTHNMHIEREERDRSLVSYNKASP